MSPDTKEEKREKLERRVEALASEIAGLINTSHGGERNDLRDLALSIVREEVRTGEETLPEESKSNGKEHPFNPIVMGVPVFFMGAVMVVLFPPVGMLLFAVAFLLVGWGVVMAVLSRR